jgi:probable HAF family extracellular repeat protein
MKTRRLFLYAILTVVLIINNFVCAYINVIDLGAGFAHSINDSGQIVGQTSNVHACLFDSTGGWANIDLGAGNAASINNNGQIVGYTSGLSIFGTRNYACLFDSTGSGNNRFIGVDTFENPNYDTGSGSAFSINNQGQVVGTHNFLKSLVPSVYSGACLFDTSDTPWPLDRHLSDSISTAYTINDNGQIAGRVRNASNVTHGFIFDPTGGGANTDLGTLGSYSNSAAYSLNNSGQITGSAYYTVYNSSTHTYTTYSRACLFDSTGGGNNIDLGSLDGYPNSGATSINDNGQIVGSVSNSLGTEHACLFDPTGGGNNIDLNTLINPSSGWILMSASDINNNGWIVGYGTIIGRQDYHAFLIVPEPATIILFTLGGLAVMGRKKKL